MQLLPLITCLFWKEKNTQTQNSGGRNIAKLFLKKYITVSTPGQNKKNIYCRVKKLRKQEERN